MQCELCASAARPNHIKLSYLQEEFGEAVSARFCSYDRYAVNVWRLSALLLITAKTAMLACSQLLYKLASHPVS